MRGHVVKWFPERGFGFIKPEKISASDVYLHVSKVVEGNPHYGSDVEFKMSKDNTKRTFAIDVKVTN